MMKKNSIGGPIFKKLSYGSYKAPLLFFCFIIATFFILAWPFFHLLFQQGLHPVPMERTLLWSLSQAFFSTLISVILAWPMSYFFHRFSVPGRYGVQFFLLLPQAVPILIFVLMMCAIGHLFFPFTFFSFLFSFYGLIVTQGLFNIGIAFYFFSHAWDKFPLNWRKTQQIFPAYRLFFFRKIFFPFFKPFFLQTFLLIFIYCFYSFIFVLYLCSIPSNFEVQAYIQLRGLSIPTMLYYLVIQLFICLLIYLCFLPGLKHNPGLQVSQINQHRVQSWKKMKEQVKTLKDYFVFFPLLLVLVFVLSLFALLYFSLFWQSIQTHHHWALTNYLGVLHLSYLTTLVLIVLTFMFLFCLTFLLISFPQKKIWIYQGLSWVLILSSLTISSPYYFYLQQIDQVWIVYLLLSLIYAFLFWPVLIRLAEPFKQRFPEAWVGLSYQMHVGYFTIFSKLYWPFYKPLFLLCFFYTLIGVVSENSIVVILGHSQIHTLALDLYGDLMHYRYQQAYAMAVFLLVLMGSIFFFLHKIIDQQEKRVLKSITDKNE